jgi:hypothetical protein
MPYPVYHAGPYGQAVHYDPTQYNKPAAAPTRTVAAATPPAGPPYPGYMSPEDQQALALAQAHGAYDPVLEVYRKQQERQSFANMAQQAGLAKLYDVLGGSMAGFSGQVADIYNTAGQGLSSFDAGYGHGVELAKQSLQAQGAGYAQSFGALPAISGQQGAVKYLTAVQEGNAADQKLQDLIDSTAAEIPGKAQSFLADIQSEQGKLQTNYQTLQSREADRALKQGNAALAQAWRVADRFTKGTKRTYVAVIDKNGNPQVVDAGASATKPTAHHYTATAGGDVLDTSTGKVVGQVTVKPSAPGKPTYWTDTVTGDRHMTTGQGADTIIVPGTKKAKVPTPKTPTPLQASTAVQNWYAGKTATERVPVMKDGKPVVNKKTGVPVYVSRTGQPTGKKTYQQAYRILTSKAYNLSDVAARQLLDQTWKRGEGQRPWVSAPQRAALARAGLKPVATYYKGQKQHPFLSQQQATALQQAHLLPPGELVNGRYFIAPGY